MSLMPQAPVVFLQYLAALAIVEGIKTYDRGYDRMPAPQKNLKLIPYTPQSRPTPPTPPEKPSSRSAASS
ncbi:MAG: hypothetical protein Q9210_002974 [Variospora velana]